MRVSDWVDAQGKCGCWYRPTELGLGRGATGGVGLRSERRRQQPARCPGFNDGGLLGPGKLLAALATSPDKRDRAGVGREVFRVSPLKGRGDFIMSGVRGWGGR